MEQLAARYTPEELRVKISPFFRTNYLTEEQQASGNFLTEKCNETLFWRVD